MNPLPDHKNDTELADELANFFISKINTIKKKFTNIALYALQDSNIQRLWKFDTMSEEGIKKIIILMKSNSYELDPILTTLHKDMQPILLLHLTEIINRLLTKGMFIERLKTAIVRPLLKKLSLQ